MKRDYIAEVIAEDAAARGNACAPIPRYKGCQIQQKEADRKLRLALSKAFNSDVLAETAMRVVRECRE